MDDKEIILQEYHKTMNRLRERGINTSRVSFILSDETVDSDKMYWGMDRPFIKMFLDYMPKLALKLSGGAMATALRLTEYINYDSNLLSKRGGNPLNNEDIQQIMEYSKKTVIRIMDELVSNKVLFRGRTGHSYQYYANPYLFNKGKYVNKTLAAMFKDYPDEFKSF
jgi:hypothetical protein